MSAVFRNARSWETLAGCLCLIPMGSSLKELWPEASLVSKSVAEWFLYKPSRWNFVVSQSLTNFWNGDSSLSGLVQDAWAPDRALVVMVICGYPCGYCEGFITAASGLLLDTANGCAHPRAFGVCVRGGGGSCPGGSRFLAAYATCISLVRGHTRSPASQEAPRY